MYREDVARWLEFILEVGNANFSVRDGRVVPISKILRQTRLFPFRTLGLNWPPKKGTYFPFTKPLDLIISLLIHSAARYRI